MSSLKSINAKFICDLNYSENETCEILIGSSYKVLRLNADDCDNHPSMREAIDLITAERFSSNFLKAGRAFVINVKVSGGLLPLNANQLTLLSVYRDRPMIFYFECIDGGYCIYYREENSFKCISNVPTITVQEFLNLKFSFELLLSALKSKFCGKLTSSFRDTQLNVNPKMDEYRLIYLAVLSNNQLCIRFLSLFENFVEFIDNYSIVLLQHAARSCDFDSFLAIFDLNFDQKEFNMGNREILSIKDACGFNLLMIAAEVGNVSATIFLLNLNYFDVNYEVSGITAASLACNIQNSEILLMLLQNDSKYPKNYHKMKLTNDLEIFVNKICEFHDAIARGDKKKSKEIIYNLKLRYYFNEFNKSAAFLALECEQFKIYEYLLINKSSICDSHEKMENIPLDEDSKSYLKFIHNKYESALYEKCIIEIEKKVHCLNINELYRSKYQFELRCALYSLYDIKTSRPVLEIIASSDIQLVLDFERNSVKYLDPSERPSTRGYYENDKILIGALDLLSDEDRKYFLATLIHEMTHFVMDSLYYNHCKPFVTGDVKRENDFRVVYENSKKNASKERIIEAVYNYQMDFHYSELIVRPNHLMAYYYDNEEMRKECERNFPELFHFYRERIIGDMLNRLESLASMNCGAKKRKFYGKFRDEETIVLIDDRVSDFKHEKRHWRLLLLIFVIISLIITFLILKFHNSPLHQPIALRQFQSQCYNASHPWNDLIRAKNTSQIELNTNLDNWNVTSTCNPLTLAIEAHSDVDFVEDLVNIAEEAFESCGGKLKRILVNTLRYFDENDYRDGKILNYLKNKLNGLLNAREHRSYLNGKFDEIGIEC